MFLFDQYFEEAASQMYSPPGDSDSQACPSNSGSDSSWLEFLVFPDDDDSPPPEGSVSSGSVADATSDEMEPGIDLKWKASQLTSSPDESMLMPIDINGVPTIPVDVERQTEYMDLDGSCPDEVPTAMSTTPEHWNFVASSSTSPSSDGSRDGTERSSSSPSVKSFSPESSENYKVMIPRCSPFKCPHCHTLCSSESRHRHLSPQCNKRIRYVCDACSKPINSEKDLRRHKTAGCPFSLTEKSFACTCGQSYYRKDHLKRHINGSKEGARQQHKAV